MKLLEKNLDGIKEFLRQDNDWLHVNFGYQGTGKSTLLIRMCQAIDPDFCHERITFTPEQFLNALRTATYYQAICADEGATIWFCRNLMSSEVRDSTEILSMIRAKRLFIGINIDSPTILDKYILYTRGRSATRIRSKGRFDFFSKRRMRSIKILPDKKIIWPRPNFSDDWQKLGGKFWNDYMKIKMKFLNQRLDDKIEKYSNLIGSKEICKMLGITRNTLSIWVKKKIIKPVLKTAGGNMRFARDDAERLKRKLMV